MRVNSDPDVDGALLAVRALSLFEGDNKTSCEEVTGPAPGFPDTPEYQQTRVVCAKAAGQLVIDSKGAENGGRPCVVVDDVRGGSVTQKIKVGHSVLGVRGCVGFQGAFRVRSAAGKVKVRQQPPHRADVLSGKTRVDLNASVPLIQMTASSKYTKIGSVCLNQTFSSAGDAEGQGEGDDEGDPLPTEIDIDTEVTGDITLDVYPPYV